jgi:hypothetical protein
MEKKKLKPKIEEHSLAIRSGLEPLSIYVGGKKIGEVKPCTIIQVELNKN